MSIHSPSGYELKEETGYELKEDGTEARGGSMTAGRHLNFFLIKIIKMEKLRDLYKIKETN